MSNQYILFKSSFISLKCTKPFCDVKKMTKPINESMNPVFKCFCYVFLKTEIPFQSKYKKKHCYNNTSFLLKRHFAALWTHENRICQLIIFFTNWLDIYQLIIFFTNWLDIYQFCCTLIKNNYFHLPKNSVVKVLH